MNYTLASDEIFFQTILVNSKYLKSISNKNLRYVDWELRNGSSPAFLDLSDYDKIILSEKIFARKFNNISEALLEKLIKVNKNDNDFEI